MANTTSAHVCTVPETTVTYIENLPAWDGVPRLDTWLPHVLDETPEYVGMYRMEYLALAGRYWLLGMVQRALEPGCKFDHCLVLEGPQGTGKSWLLRALAGEEFFSNSPSELYRRRSAKEELQRVWLYEIAELAAFDRTDVEVIKAFISSTSDSYRAPYAAQISFYPRQFVIAATTHNDRWRSSSDTRRFWPVPVPSPINVEWAITWRDQLFAEAKARIQELNTMPDLGSHRGKPGTPRRGGAA